MDRPGQPAEEGLTPVTEEEAHRIARTAAKEAVHETLQLIGLDINNPADLQRDFQFMRSWRLSSEAVKRQGLLAIVSTLVIGLLGLIYMAFKGSP